MKGLAKADVGVAKRQAVVKNGRVPLHACNPQAKPLTLGGNQNLGKLYHIHEVDMHEPCYLNLSLEGGSVIEVMLVDAMADQ